MHEHPLVKKPYDPSEHQYPQWISVDGKDVLIADATQHEAVLAGEDLPASEQAPEVAPAGPYDPANHQYPQWVTIKVDGKDKAFLVQNVAEHQALLGSDNTEILDKNALIERADKVGIKIDKRWSAEKIRDALAAG
jgi:hypothetical protein